LSVAARRRQRDQERAQTNAEQDPEPDNHEDGKDTISACRGGGDPRCSIPNQAVKATHTEGTAALAVGA
jgi:hypothetical protein